MRDKYIQTAESVTEGYPGKLCDTIADTVLDACLRSDPTVHVAYEVLDTAGKILVADEIIAAELPDTPALICWTVWEAGYGGSNYKVKVITHDQGGDIAGVVSQEEQAGAGDQGILYDYACSETSELLSLPAVLAHHLTRPLTHAQKTGTTCGLKPDGKAQVSVEYVFGLFNRVTSVVASCQCDADKDLEDLWQEILECVVTPTLQELPPDGDIGLPINPPVALCWVALRRTPA